MARSLVIAVLLFAFCSGTPSELESKVDSWAETNNVAAVSVAIGSPEGAMTLVSGSRDGDVPSPGALYEVGSLTKTLVAATTLSLAEDGIVDLDDPVARWLPSFPRGDAITLRQLLSHTAGLSDGREEEPDLSDVVAFLDAVEPSELVDAAASYVGDSGLPAPFEYANSGYWVVGAILEEATGSTLEELVRDQVLTPLGLDDTYLAWTGSPPLVPGELAGPNGDAVSLGSEVLPGMVSRAWAAGGVASTASDMAVFYAGLFNGLLQEASLEEMAVIDGYGLGIDRRRWGDGVDGWGHNGAIPGYTSSAGVSDDGWTVVVLTNRFTVTAAGLDPDTEAFVGELLRQVASEPSS